MINLAKSFRNLALLLSAALASFATAAQAQNSPCGITGSASAAPIVYDPFNPSGLASTNITLNLTRVNTTGGGDTRFVNFYLKANSSTGTGANGASIVANSVSGSAAVEGVGLNIFYDYLTPAPTLPLNPINGTPSGANRYLEINFTGNNAGSDTAQVNFTVSLPANLNLNAVQNLAFDAFFTCNIQGGQSNGATNTGTFSNAVVFPVTVLSALRTYYAGTALDFGEIGNIATGTLAGSPKKTSTSNYVFVQSSGAYSVTLSSQNGFKLFKPSAAVANDKIDYRLRFLGADVDSTTANSGPGGIAITKSCQRATLSSTGNQLPIQAKLVEGGQGKNPSPTYSDILTVTVTPLIYSDPGTNACGTFNLTGF